MIFFVGNTASQQVDLPALPPATLQIYTIDASTCDSGMDHSAG